MFCLCLFFAERHGTKSYLPLCSRLRLIRAVVTQVVSGLSFKTLYSGLPVFVNALLFESSHLLLMVALAHILCFVIFHPSHLQ